MDLNQYYEQIEAYLSNALSAADKADFEAQIKAQPALKRAVWNHVLANEALGLAIEDKVAGKLEKLAQKRKIEATTPSLKVWWKQPLTIAATILFLILVGTTIWVNQNYSNQALANYGYAQGTLPTVRGEAAENASFSDGLVTFTNQEYATSIEHFTKISINNQTYIPVQYLLGHAYFNTGNFEASITSFDKVLASPNPPKTIDLQEVEWNKLMAELNIQGVDNNEFLTGLNAILANPEHAYYTEAAVLYKQLDSPWRNLMW